MPDQDAPLAEIPESRIEVAGHRISLVWLIPLVAAVAGAWIAVTRILGAGPEITLALRSAEGLEAGKTKVEYNGVDIGTLTTIRLSEDHQGVVASVQMAPKTEGFLVEDTRFWVVRPRISGATVTGLGTLISGSYIGMEIGQSQVAKREFVALETQPVVTSEVAGRFFVLKAPDLGSLDSGTPLYFRHLDVGQVTAYELDEDGRSLTVEAFVSAPYDQYVTADTRFWHASGIDVSLSASGMSVQTESFLSILVGGIAFETPANGPVLPEAAARTVFTLFEDRAAAFELPPQDPQTLGLVFEESVRGLAPGAPVEFHGIPIGAVTDVRAQMDMATGEFSVLVLIELDAAKLGVKFVNLQAGEDRAAARRRVIDSLVARGLRAQIQTASLLTGANLVAVDFFPDAPPEKVDWSQDPVRIPTAPGDFEALEASLTRIVKKLDALPIQAIGDDLRQTIADLDPILTSLRRTVDDVDEIIVKKLGALPYESIGDEIRKAVSDFDQTVVSARRALDNVGELTEPGSDLSADVSGTLQDVARAARDLGLLMDYLQRHPEALIRGKSGDSK